MFEKGDIIENIHTKRINVVSKIDYVKNLNSEIKVYELDDGTRFNMDYEKHFRLAEVSK